MFSEPKINTTLETPFYSGQKKSWFRLLVIESTASCKHVRRTVLQKAPSTHTIFGMDHFHRSLEREENLRRPLEYLAERIFRCDPDRGFRPTIRRRTAHRALRLTLPSMTQPPQRTRHPAKALRRAASSFTEVVTIATGGGWGVLVRHGHAHRAWRDAGGPWR